MTPARLHPPARGDRPTPASRPLLLGALGALLLLAGCVKNFPNPFDRSGGQASSVELYVDNQNFNDVRLYKTGVEGRASIGFVTGRSTRTFEVPWRQTTDFVVQIEVLAGRTYRSNRVTATPGDRLQLLIRDNPNNTYLTRR